MKHAVVNLPKLQPDEYVEHNILPRKLAEKNRELRLRALLIAPEEFASTYEVEVERGLTHILDRLGNSQADHFFAIETHAEWNIQGNRNIFEELLRVRWIGMIVLIGPQGPSSPSATADPLAQETDRTTKVQLSATANGQTLRYHLSDMFVEPVAQRQGIGKALIEAALGKARGVCRQQDASFHCSIFVDSENSAARSLYQNIGFTAVGEESYVQLSRRKAGEPRTKTPERKAIQMEIT
ncbi:hypothetical protein CLAFUW4_01108 [Fulvia fulva]|uniref:N-acetyltransferase domain-containing protein n=1 Tax=Passalora fulva TaxID=5499 RepID=A0A9Q8L4H6_PASFU|nr:uncharacterized protein CLAFUR5_01113 [Fulvia fulva]KAK4634825.1 hypothetical protein CLAFUR4_01109 [Fulvia fulva]KAK4636583.1 hypothetical protein CLAFUR0_01110 [Fulvia fulva]UJO10750.1 hypothetical protein CLAFUR5_01113 [Fulvia fulva]WPV09913.1 hypothetical protein CLAFUW4_01108 [Fulvia fulva]WPV23126.1 hypothetical protein CLAFUW7_01113 [Fulvia fulva]